MRATRRSLLTRLVPGAALLGMGAAGAGQARTGGGVVYHISDSARAVAALRNIRNHRDADPDIRIVVVALAGGIDFLLEGAKDANGNDFNALVEPLEFKNVTFKACGNTLETRGLDADNLHLGVEVTPTGMAEIARLQLEEGYAYIKP